MASLGFRVCGQPHSHLLILELLWISTLTRNRSLLCFQQSWNSDPEHIPENVPAHIRYVSPCPCMTGGSTAIRYCLLAMSEQGMGKKNAKNYSDRTSNKQICHQRRLQWSMKSMEWFWREWLMMTRLPDFVEYLSKADRDLFRVLWT